MQGIFFGQCIAASDVSQSTFEASAVEICGRSALHSVRDTCATTGGVCVGVRERNEVLDGWRRQATSWCSQLKGGGYLL